MGLLIRFAEKEGISRLFQRLKLEENCSRLILDFIVKIDEIEAKSMFLRTDS